MCVGNGHEEHIHLGRGLLEVGGNEGAEGELEVFVRPAGPRHHRGQLRIDHGAEDRDEAAEEPDEAEERGASDERHHGRGRDR